MLTTFLIILTAPLSLILLAVPAATIVIGVGRTHAHWVALFLDVVYLLRLWSRVYVGVHHPSDVAAGGLFSLAWASALTRVCTSSGSFAGRAIVEPGH